ncbi:MAG: sigma-70 family RNA polymerase sigma factor [Oscillochloris sp.]|nr:sigma-70 family RNA polymerase sigma factor [Oscillochloris sp.]
MCRNLRAESAFRYIHIERSCVDKDEGVEDEIALVSATTQNTGATDQATDETLMMLIAEGDSIALARLYDRYSRVVYGLALRILGNAEPAEDIVQETFWRVWKRSTTFQASQGQVAPWLFGIARNLCIDELRRRQSRPATISNGIDTPLIAALPDLGQDVEALSWEIERRQLIVGALSELPADQRQVIELAYFGGLSQREIAAQLESPLGTIKTRIRLALQKLKGSLQQLGVGQDDR